jgi:fused signal recognition particle receptor
MGLFDKIKSIISRKKDIVEEVKEEYDVEEVNDIDEDTIPEESEDKEIKKENYELPALGDEEPKEEEEELEDSEVEDDESEDEEEIEEESEDEEESEEEEETEEEEAEEDEDEFDDEESDEDDEDDEDWLNFVKEQQNKNKVEEAKDIETYDKGLEKTRKEFVSKLSLLGVKYTKIDDEYYDELEELLINADVGVNTVMSFMDRLRDRVKKEKITDTAYLNEIIVDELFIIYVDNQSLSDKINIASEGPTVILMVGVNGVGKTTTIGKLAYKYKNEGKKVMLVAGDTFRAGAVKQLEEWADRTGCIFYGKEETDPAGVVFDGLVKAKEENVDIVLVDTAGRLQNKVDLMKELEKINKVIERHIPGAPHETLLVIDATTGQNGISQAIAFKEITNITGIVLTKLDGTAKGGIVLAIKEEVKIPVKFIGLGEKMTDLKAFDIENYIYGLFKDMM